MTKATGLAAGLLGLALVLPGYPDQQNFSFGKQKVALSLAYSPATPVGGAIRNVQYGYVAPRWGIGITDPIGGDSWYRGSIEFLAEGALLGEISRPRGIGGGMTALIRYSFLAATHLVPFITLGGGLVALDFDLKHQKDGLNFTGHWGAGLHYFFSERTALTGEWRIHHISNGEGSDNRGITNHLFFGGVSCF